MPEKVERALIEELARPDGPVTRFDVLVQDMYCPHDTFTTLPSSQNVSFQEAMDWLSQAQGWNFMIVAHDPERTVNNPKLHNKQIYMSGTVMDSLREIASGIRPALIGFARPDVDYHEVIANYHNANGI